jgi:hypothetical protein
MKRRAAVLVLGVGMLMLTTAPVEGQLFNHPDYAIPSFDGGSSTFVATSYGRGLNDDSGKLNAFSATVGRSTSGLSFQAGVGYIDNVVESEWTLGGAAGYSVLGGDAPAQVGIQAGLGWMQLGDPTGTVGDITLLRFPVGVVVRGDMGSSSLQVSPWVMPRLNIMRLSAEGASTTETDFGASAGVGLTMPSGLGIHAALDLLAVSVEGAPGTEQLRFGIGAHYVLGR